MTDTNGLTDDTCHTEVTQDELDEISRCEAVVIREYEKKGCRYGRLIAWGDADEMRDVARAPGTYVVPVGVKIICDSMVLVTELGF